MGIILFKKMAKKKKKISQFYKKSPGDNIIIKHYPDDTIGRLVKRFERAGIPKSPDGIRRRKDRLVEYGFDIKKSEKWKKKIKKQNSSFKSENEVNEMKNIESISRYFKKYRGKDKKRGRPLLLNTQELEKQEKKDYASIVFWGDVHYGAPNCNIEKALNMLEYCMRNHVYIFVMGDLIDCGTKASVADSVYQQIGTPDTQLEFMSDILRPVADEGLILGIHRGNHEFRIDKAVGFNISKYLAKMLGVPYLHDAGWSLIKVGNQNYKFYTLHGTSNATMTITKLAAAKRVARRVASRADVVAHAHVHAIASDVMTNMDIDIRRRQIVNRNQLILLTGHYLEYIHSYAQTKSLEVSPMGSPKIKVSGVKHRAYYSH